MLVASAGGLYPMTMAPIYSAAKAGVVQFARSIGPPLAERGIAVSALCPQPTDTPMVHKWFTSGDPLPETGTATLSVEQVGWMNTRVFVYMCKCVYVIEKCTLICLFFIGVCRYVTYMGI